MQQVLVVFASLSHMNLVKRSFREEGRYFDAMRAPKCIAAGGCSHAILCVREDAREIVMRAKASGLNYRGAYEISESDDGVEYIPIEPLTPNHKVDSSDLSGQCCDILAETAMRN